MKKTIISNSADETYNMAIELGNNSTKGNIFALIGELGSGKTIIAKGIAKGLDIDEDITSPTFNLLEIYKGRLPLYHFDLYRIENEVEFDNLFFEEYWEGDGVSVIEWADKALSRYPKNIIKINVEYIAQDTRRITIEHPGN